MLVSEIASFKPTGHLELLHNRRKSREILILNQFSVKVFAASFRMAVSMQDHPSKGPQAESACRR